MGDNQMSRHLYLLFALILSMTALLFVFSGCTDAFGGDKNNGFGADVGEGEGDAEEENGGSVPEVPSAGDKDDTSENDPSVDIGDSQDKDNNEPSDGDDKTSDGDAGNDDFGDKDEPGHGSGTDAPPVEDEENEPALPDGVAVFDDLTLGKVIGKTAVSSNGVSFYYNEGSGASATIVKDPRGDGYSFRFAKSNTAKGDTVVFTPIKEGTERFVAEFDISFDSTSYNVPLQINLDNSYRLQLEVQGDTVLVYDAKSDGSIKYFLGAYFALDDFARIRVEYYYGDGTLDGQYAKIYFNGELFAISQNSFTKTPSKSYGSLKFYSLINSDAVFYIDNVFAAVDDVSFVDDGEDDTLYYYADDSKNDFFDTRFLVAEAILGKEAAVALAELCSIFDEGTYIWLANLYDPETGGFYYSNDARDYEGFLPDIESTGQAMGLLNSMGLGVAQTMYTDEMAAKIVAWVQSLQSNEDGYFYHPQWGTDINSSRRGRDLGSAIGVLNRFGAKPLYPTALDRLSGNVATSENITSPLGGSVVQAVSYVVSAATTSVNAHLASPEAFVAYLDDLFATKTETNSKGETVPNSYVIGHTVGSQASQIKAAGLTDVCINYFNERQNPENGLWEDEENYRTASGLLKIRSFYNSLSAKFPNPDKAVRSAINIASSEEPMSAVVYVYNPLSALSNILSNLNKYNTDEGSAELRLTTINEMRSRATELIYNTMEKLKTFKKADGSFSYNANGAPAQSQGADVCFGENEGDVNGTALVNGTISALYNSIGLTKPEYYDSEDKAAFWDIIYEKQPVEKHSATKTEVDFEGYGGGDELPRFTRVSLSETGTYEISEAQVYGRISTAMKVSSFKGYNDAVKITIPKSNATTDVSCYAFETDIKFDPHVGNSSAILMQIRMDLAYMLTVEVRSGKLCIYDSTSTGAGNVNGDLGIYVAIGEWFNLRVEYFPGDKNTTVALVYIDGELAAVSNNYYGQRAGGVIPDPRTEVTYINFMTLNAASVDFSLDNIVVEKSAEKASVPGHIYDFEGSRELPDGVTVNGGEGNCTAEIKGDSNGYYLETKTVSGYGHNVIFESRPYLGERIAYVFAADLQYVSSNNTTVTQLFMGGKDGTVFALDIKYGNGKISIVERTSKGQGAELIKNIDASKPFRIEVVYYPDEGCAEIKVTSGDVTTTAETSAYYSTSSIGGDLDYAKLYSLLGAVYTLNIDNVEVYNVLNVGTASTDNSYG